MTFTKYFFYGLRGSLGFLVRRFVLGLVNLIAFHPSYEPLQDLRIGLLRLVGFEIGNKVKFSEKIFILYLGRLKVGDASSIGTHLRVYNFTPIEIGCRLLASHGLTLISGTHDVHTLADKPGPIKIGSDVWIGINVTIIGPIIIGNNVIIGAGSVVLNDIPDNAIAAGVPARVIRLKEGFNKDRKVQKN